MHEFHPCCIVRLRRELRCGLGFGREEVEVEGGRAENALKVAEMIFLKYQVHISGRVISSKPLVYSLFLKHRPQTDTSLDFGFPR